MTHKDPSELCYQCKMLLEALDSDFDLELCCDHDDESTEPINTFWYRKSPTEKPQHN